MMGSIPSSNSCLIKSRAPVFLVILFVAAFSPLFSQSFPGDPYKAEIVYSDIDLFWKAYDRIKEDDAKNPFEEYYLKKGSVGLRDFVPERIESADELYKLVLKERAYYDRVRASTLTSMQYEKQIRAAYYALKYWYPKAVFPPLYFVIGRTTSGGTASKAGMIIGIEVFSETPFSTAYGRPTLRSELIPFTVAHEIVHFLQPESKGGATLLSECIREGSADFIAELTSGEKVKVLNGDNVYPYGEKNEKALLAEFLKQKDSKELAPWLYAQTKDGRPQNLGYWIGYKIAKSYFEAAKDKKKAVNDILNTTDYQKFFEQSGYGTS